MSGPITQEQIRAFAVAWYEALDFHAPAEELLAYAADEGLQIIFPEKTLHGIGDLKAWGRRRHLCGWRAGARRLQHLLRREPQRRQRRRQDRRRHCGSRGGRGLAGEPVGQPAAKSKRVSLDATQAWIVRRSTKNAFGLELVSYNAMAKPFAYAPGFARL